MTVEAKDAANNIATRNYTVPVASGTGRTLAYDLVGNMTNNGAGQSYEWDGVNRLTKITYTGGAKSEFTYDGLGRRVKVVEKNSGGAVTSEKRFVWDGLSVAEERDGSNVLAKRFYAQGVMAGSDELYYSTDHLGSIRELTDDAGAVQARYEYDPYGRTSRITGSNDADFLYTSHYYHSRSSLYLVPYRTYSATLGRWTSRDPIEEKGGLILYGYVLNNPVLYFDPLGLEIRVYSSDAFGIKGLNHAYVWSTEQGTGIGQHGSSGGYTGSGVGDPSKDPFNVARLPLGMSEKKFYENVRMDLENQRQKAWPWLLGANDCHAQLRRAFEKQGVAYPGAPNGRTDFDDYLRTIPASTWFHIIHL